MKKSSKVVIVILSALLAISLYANAVMVYRINRDLAGYRLAEERGDELGNGNGDESALSESERAPDFSVRLLTGETFTLSDHRGTVVVLDFWATWCGACVVTMPTVQALSEQFEGSVIFVGMNVAEDADRVRDFIAERGFTYPIGLDEHGDIHRELFPSPGIPYKVIIDGEGRITTTILGGGDSMHGPLEEAIMEAIG